LLFAFSVASKNDCACLVTTYNKLSRLWDNKDKQEYEKQQQQLLLQQQQQQSNQNKHSDSSVPYNPYPMNSFVSSHNSSANNTYAQLGMNSYPTHPPMHFVKDTRDTSSCSGL
jgi:hypothetical protein